jgi:protein-S-isoprenylcysteine O-methyltransferase Ste14
MYCESKKKWIDFLYKTATGSRRVRNVFTPLGASVFAIFLILIVIISLSVDKLLRFPSLFTKPLNIILSTPFFFIGGLLAGWSILIFLKQKGTPVPFNPPPRLVTTGPYAHVRNPMLSGIFCLLFGAGVFLGSISLIFVFTPLFICLNFWELKAIEEPELSKRLGRDYDEYKKRTPMFIPHVKRKLDEAR